MMQAGAFDNVTKKTTYVGLSQGLRNSRRNSRLSNILKREQLAAVSRKGFAETVRKLMREHKKAGA